MDPRRNVQRKDERETMKIVNKFNIYDMEQTRTDSNQLYALDKYYGVISRFSNEQTKALRRMMNSKTLRYSCGQIIPDHARVFINNIRGYEVEESLSKIAHYFKLEYNSLRLRKLSGMTNKKIGDILFCAENIMNHPALIGEDLRANFQLPLEFKYETFVNARWVTENGRTGRFEISYGQMLPVKNSKVYHLNDFEDSRPY